jgi:putative ABC transport system permease protein
MNIPFRPMLSAMSRHKATAFLLAAQIALTLAIVANAVFVIDQRVMLMLRPTGIDESNTIVVENRWVDELSPAQVQAKTAADLAMLRQLPAVADAYSDYSFPGAGPVAEVWGISLVPGQIKPLSYAEPYYADEHALRTYGLRLVAGRNFEAGEILLDAGTSKASSGPVLITQDLAVKLFGSDSALGKVIYVGDVAKTVVGITVNLQVPAVGTHSFAYRSILTPVRYSDPTGSQYIIHTKPGQQQSVKSAVAAALFEISASRIIDESTGAGVQNFDTLRSRAYARDRGLIILLCITCVILLLATGGGIVGVTVLWVSERHREIGLRRALGATRLEIAAHILTENFFIVSAGIAVGAALAFVANIALMHFLEMSSLPAVFIALGSFLVLVLGQCSALLPARHASRIAPMEAMRLASRST